MSTKVVCDGLVQQITLYKPAFWLYRLDVLPFLLFYAIFFSIASSFETNNKYIGLIALPIGLSTHLLIFLVAQCSVRIRCFLGYQLALNESDCEYVHIEAAKNAGNDKLVKLYSDRRFSKATSVEVLGKTFKISQNRIEFQKVSYDFDQERNLFEALDYPSNASVKHFLRWTGYKALKDVGLGMIRWGTNEFSIPIPNFLDLYLEHLVAPFFVFQVLCLFLWSLDDYWYYSAFTLLMLMFFEGMMCRQRQSSLLMLRNMRRPPVQLFVYRANHWNIVSSASLIPGDLISLAGSAPMHRNQGGNNEPENIVPCDAVLIRGSCVVNEAMLTGESVPQMKESLTAHNNNSDDVDNTSNINDNIGDSKIGNNEEEDHKLGKPYIRDSNSAAATSSTTSWKRNTVYSGTAMLKHTELIDSDDNGSKNDTTLASMLLPIDTMSSLLSHKQQQQQDAAGTLNQQQPQQIRMVPGAPDGGCLAVVIRTGFGTIQGELMRKILFAAERIGGGSSTSSYEALYFIGVLVIFAVLAASIVLYGGLRDEKRNKFRLVLHCIMIITSVVPPELPMELSLAVTNSLAALARQLVYCTEPFRIAYAGRIDTVCFDKTGTITKDEMILRGVVAPQRDIPLLLSTTTTAVVKEESLSFSSNRGRIVASSNKRTNSRVVPFDLNNIVCNSSSSSKMKKNEEKEKMKEEEEEEDMMLEEFTLLEEDRKQQKQLSTSLSVNSNGAYEDIVRVTVGGGGAYDVVLAIMGACNDLMLPTNKMSGKSSPIGDPLEIAAFESSGYRFSSTSDVTTYDYNSSNSSSSRSSINGIVLINNDSDIALRVKHKYPFTSELKRMSVIVEISPIAASIAGNLTSSSKSRESSSSAAAAAESVMVFTKGAPEVVVNYLSKVPNYYNATYYYHMCKGRRVLALACKRLLPPSNTLKTGSSSNAAATKLQYSKLSRKSAESDLLFVGFLVFDCDLKVDSKSVVRELRASAHRVVMITGDSVYTAAEVARQLGMIKTFSSTTTTLLSNSSNGELSNSSNKKGKNNGSLSSPSTAALILHSVSNKNEITSSSSNQQLVWRSLSSSSFNNNNDKDLDDIDYQPDSTAELATEYSLCVTGSALDALQRLLSCHNNDSVVAASGYELVLRKLCPHITIFARVSPVQKESILLALNDAGLYTLMCGDGTNDVGALKAAHVGVSIVNDPILERRSIEGTKDSSSSSRKSVASSAKERLARAVQEMQEHDMDPTIVKLGDASIASPFTARRTSIDSVLTVIRQGRCTLVTTVQVYKVLALNCLISAYMMSALYLRGLKQGDTQMTAQGLVIAGMFFFLSQAKPLSVISAKKPVNTVFAMSVCLSLLGQFIVHFICLLAVLQLCEQYVPLSDFSLTADGKFQPNIVNSSVFLLSAWMQVNNFVVNYRGHPFTQSISENIMLWRSVQLLYGTLLIIAGGQVEPLNDLLQMAPFPSSQFQGYLIAILAANFCICYMIENLCQRIE